SRSCWRRAISATISMLSLPAGTPAISRLQCKKAPEWTPRKFRISGQLVVERYGFVDVVVIPSASTTLHAIQDACAGNYPILIFDYERLEADIAAHAVLGVDEAALVFRLQYFRVPSEPCGIGIEQFALYRSPDFRLFILGQWPWIILRYCRNSNKQGKG